MQPSSDIGIVVIGRNEGERLRACLASVTAPGRCVVYVDSGSTDASLELARSFGAEIVALDPALRFTAARARNAGFARLRSLRRDIALVQFIDGDCELASRWLDEAAAALERDPAVAVVCGRRRERRPAASPYNQLCDMEWDTPVGEAASCGGDAMMRAHIFEQVGGFSPDLIAGEEPDLCHRLRRDGWKIRRLPFEMTLHDAAMTRLSQWWRRNRRSGYASAEAWRRRGREEPELLRRVLSDLVWALPPAWLFWPLLWWRVFRRRGALYATHIVAGKLPHFQGQADFWLDRWRGRSGVLIEYK